MDEKASFWVENKSQQEIKDACFEREDWIDSFREEFCFKKGNVVKKSWKKRGAKDININSNQTCQEALNTNKRKGWKCWRNKWKSRGVWSNSSDIRSKRDKKVEKWAQKYLESILPIREVGTKENPWKNIWVSWLQSSCCYLSYSWIAAQGKWGSACKIVLIWWRYWQNCGTAGSFDPDRSSCQQTTR